MQFLINELIKMNLLFLPTKKLVNDSKFNLLSPVEFLKQIKYFITLIKFLSKKKCIIIFYTEDPNLKHIFSILKKMENDKKLFFCNEKDHFFIANSSGKRPYKIIFIIGKTSKMFINFLLHNKIYAINIFDMFIKEKVIDINSINGNFKDLKKIIWLITVLRTIIRN